MAAMDVDCGNPRPLKRQRLSPCSTQETKGDFLEPLPLPVLLLSLPNLLLHPPTHRDYSKSVHLSFLAFWRCLAFENLDSDVECRAWTGLAELGFRLGLGEQGIEHEVEKAITKGLLIAQNHPSLRPYKVHLTLLSARLSQYQHNFKFAQNTIRRLSTTFLTPQDPPHLIYGCHLGHIASFSNPDSTGALVPTFKALSAIQDLHEAAHQNQHWDVIKLAAVLRLQNLIQMGCFDQVQEALKAAEELLQFPSSDDASKLAESAAIFAHTKRSPTDTAFLLYTLILGVMFYTYIGESPKMEARTKILHEMLDGGALDAIGTSGGIRIDFPSSQPLYIQTSHPRVLFLLVFLITSIAKRDPVGRKPKRKVFASEGLLGVERELKKETDLSAWASAGDVQELYLRFHKLKADLMCEVVGVCIARSEFGEAERTLAEVIAHTRTEDIFSSYSARITLLQAQLAHALGHTERALQCYQVAAYLSRKRDTKRPFPSHGIDDNDEGVEDQWLHTAAKTGEVWLRIGLFRQKIAAAANTTSDECGEAAEAAKQGEEELRRMAEDILSTCDGLGGTLGAIASVLRACLTNEFLKAKMYLRHALQLVTASNDNHLRALILALIASQYLNTSTEHAEAMLATAEQLAAGLGAQPRANKGATQPGQLPAPPKPVKTGGDGVGNAPLRLWIGERTIELKRRAGDDEAARKQEVLNAKLRFAVTKIEQRQSLLMPIPLPSS